MQQLLQLYPELAAARCPQPPISNTTTTLWVHTGSSSAHDKSFFSSWQGAASKHQDSIKEGEAEEDVELMRLFTHGNIAEADKAVGIQAAIEKRRGEVKLHHGCNAAKCCDLLRRSVVEQGVARYVEKTHRPAQLKRERRALAVRDAIECLEGRLQCAKKPRVAGLPSDTTAESACKAAPSADEQQLAKLLKKAAASKRRAAEHVSHLCRLWPPQSEADLEALAHHNSCQMQALEQWASIFKEINELSRKVYSCGLDADEVEAESAALNEKGHNLARQRRQQLLHSMEVLLDRAGGSWNPDLLEDLGRALN
jgi:hypothetical protein